MAYIISHTEKVQPQGRQKELEALLFLFSENNSEGEDGVEYFIVDVFNDLTGADKKYTKGSDFQSKFSKNETPEQIGANLSTLFRNFLSGFPFVSFTLFYGGADSKYLCNPAMEDYFFSNFTEQARSGIVSGLTKKPSLIHPLSEFSWGIPGLMNFYVKSVFSLQRKIQKNTYQNI